MQNDTRTTTPFTVVATGTGFSVIWKTKSDSIPVPVCEAQRRSTCEIIAGHLNLFTDIGATQSRADVLDVLRQGNVSVEAVASMLQQP